MTKAEFMAQLAQELNDLSQEDVQDALQYYTEYFEEAGPENEQQVVEDLGGAHKVANIIRANLGMGAKPAQEQPKHERYGAQRAPYDYTREAQTNAGAAGAPYDYSAASDATAYNAQPSGAMMQSGTRQKNSWVWVLLLVVTAPFWLSLAGGAIGVVVSIFAAVISVIVTGAAMIAAGVVALFTVVGVAQMTAASLCIYYGSCALCIGVGMLLVMAFSKLLQLCIKAVVALFASLQRTWRGNKGVTV